MEARGPRSVRAAENSRLLDDPEGEESGSESTSGSDLEDEVTQLVYKVVDESETESPSTRRLTETMYQQSRRAASLYMALFEGEHSDDLVLGPGPSSVYSASIVFPQIARSSGYQLTYVAISLKMIVLAIICAIIQVLLVLALWKATLYLPTQGGTPHMCTYGQDTAESSSPPHGPLGITINPDKSNLEPNYNMLILRNTLWEVMQRVNVTNPAVGPVEYGVESATCRAACVFAFLVAIFSELNGTWCMAKFLARSPTLRGRDQMHAEQWISFDEPDKATKKLMLALGKKDIDFITFKMAGMPAGWKALWAWPVLGLRFAINAVLCWVGFRFLLNSGGVIDLILNALALFFIVELDLLMFTTFAKDMTRDIMDRLEPYRIPSHSNKIEAIVRNNLRREKSYNLWDVLKRALALSRTIFVVWLMLYAMYMYYFYQHCIMEVAPFTSPPIGDTYFKHRHSWKFNWQFLVGRWRSRNTTARSWMHSASNKTLCAPRGNGAEVVGCGMPTPWSGG